MRCPSCGIDADPANALCPNCHAALHIPAAPSSPYAGGPPQYGPPQYGEPAQYAVEPGYTQAPYPPAQHYGPPAGPTPDYGWPSGNYQILEPGPPPERSRSPWIWLAVVIAVVLVGAGAAVAAVKLMAKHPGGTGTGAPATTTAAPPTTNSTASGPDGKAQATAIDQLLNASSASRQKLGPALTAVDGCGDLNGAIPTLQQVTTERDGQVKQGQALAVDQLTNGTQLKFALVQALTFSLQADQKFTAWAQAVAAAGCSGHAPHDDNYAAAQTASGSATTNKQQFVALWNPLAATYGLPTRSESTV
jgi:hypothetical protein